VNQIALSPGVELAKIDGITSIAVDGKKIRIVFADGVEASIGRSDMNQNKFDIFFPNPNHVPGQNIAGKFQLLLTGNVVVQRVNEIAAKAAKKS